MTPVEEGADLALTASRYEALLAALADGVVVTDKRGVVSEANVVAHRLLHRAPLVGAPLGEVLPPGRAEVVERRNDRVRRRWRLAGEEGETVLEVVTATTFGADGGQVGAVHLLHDVTAHAQLLRLKEEFLFDVAHELRTPIASLTASLDLLHQDAATMSAAERRALLATLQRSALRLEALVENLLDVGSMQAGTFEVRAVATSLRRCVDDALVLTGHLLSAKEQEVDVKITRGADHVLADPRRTGQVLANLLSNASKYSPERSKIEVAADAHEGFVRVAVRDEGPGIGEEDRARVFDRFYRARIDRETAGGIGLGLAICRAIVEAHGGEISIATSPRGGAEVRFTLPRARAGAREGRSGEDRS